MRLVTWNINSVRMRLPLLQEMTDTYQPDVICLQETKAQDTDFPIKDIRAMGYEHTEILGMKSYNGVAILSKHKLSDVSSHDWVGKKDCRHLSAKMENGLEIHNFYVPAGGDVPDRDVNDKFGHKLDFVDEMRDWFPANKKNSDPMILVGDLNIAPLENDVWSHKQLLKIVSHTPVEVEKLNAAQDSFGWVDAMRHFVPDSERLYSWWSYRSRDWRKADKGRRLDHIWVTPVLQDKLKHMEVVKDARGWEKPSDHAPAFIDINL